MPDFAPFRGIRFAPKAGPPERGICPPYDVITSEDHRRLLAHDGRNAVRWVLGEDPEHPLGDEAEYRRRGAAFREAMARGILVQDPRRSFYLYDLEHTPPGATATVRYRVLLGALEAGPWRERGVHPHEEVRDTVVADRLRLLEASGIDAGVVQVLMDGRDGALGKLLAAAGAVPLFDGVGWDGKRHRLARIDGDKDVGALEALLASRDVIVADGHHRYTTLLEWGRRRRAERGPQTPYGRTLASVADLFADGVRIDPTHRLLLWPRDARKMPEQAAGAIVKALNAGTGEAWELTASDGSSWTVSNDPGAKWTLARRLNDCVAKLDPPPQLETFHALGAARERLQQCGVPALLCRMPAVSKEEFWRRVTDKEIFPSKTTYFVPKIPTGVVARLLEEENTAP